ncbi:MAG: zinc ribbon domain-containing protein [Candidatus Thiodiazotropha sp.]
MPTYDYLCESNGVRLEVMHKMDKTVETWGELCRLAGSEPGDTPEDAPVRKLITAAAVVNSSSLSNPEPSCASGGCCSGGVCGL